MTRKLTRQLVILLSAKRIPFKIKREGSLYTISFDQTYLLLVKQALGEGIWN